jgi:hypothetical protein
MKGTECKIHIVMVSRSMARTVIGRSNTRIFGSNPKQGINVCVRLFCACVVLCRHSPCDGLIPRPGSPTKLSARFMVSEANLEWEEARGINP